MMDIWNDDGYVMNINPYNSINGLRSDDYLKNFSKYLS